MAFPNQMMSRNGVFPLSQARPVELCEHRSLFHCAVLFDRADVLEEPMSRFSLRGHRQYSPIEGVHQAMHFAEQEGAGSATPRGRPNSAAGPEKPGVIGRVLGVRPAERDPAGTCDL